jgi:hypothetical protein
MDTHHTNNTGSKGETMGLGTHKIHSQEDAENYWRVIASRVGIVGWIEKVDGEYVASPKTAIRGTGGFSSLRDAENCIANFHMIARR